VFLVALACLVSIYIYGIADGSLAKLYHGIDSEGRICGYDDDVKDKPFLYWCGQGSLLSLTVDLSHPVCVEECPTFDGDANLTSEVADLQVPECQNLTGSSVAYVTEEWLNRYCMPKESVYKDAYDSIMDGPLDRFGTKVAEAFSGIGPAWPAYLASFFLAMALGVLYLCFLRVCSGPCIWITCLLSIVAVTLLGVYLWLNAPTVAENSGHDDAEWWTRAIAIALWVIAGLLFISLCFACSSIRYAAAAVEVAAECMWELPGLFIMPILYGFIKVIVFIILLLGFLLVFSTCDVKTADSDNGVYRTFDIDDKLWTLLIIYGILSIWVLCFLKAFYQYVLAYVVVAYYYEPYDYYGYKDMECCGFLAIAQGTCNALVFHTGSLAFGSFIITIFQVIEKFIQYLQKLNKEHGDLAIVKCLLCCCFCCVKCMEEFMSFINKNCYIQMAISSSGFCSSLRKVIQVLASIAGTVALLNGAAYIMEVFGVVLISALCGLLTYAIVTNGTFVDETSSHFVDSPEAATIIGAIVGALVAMAFMVIFDMVADTLLYCFGYDSMNGRVAHTAPEAFKELLHDHQDHY